MRGAHDIYKHFLLAGKAKKSCPMCTRAMDMPDLEVFEQVVWERSVSADVFSLPGRSKK